ncbi:MAG: sterol desaturase family protein [Burkholderiaceae bacterium]|nr:sterol desaturase family protein [Burkholderiaceae bacterium]
MESVTEAFAAAQQWLFESVVQPLLYQAGLASHLEEAFDGTGWFLVGLMQLAVMLLLIAPLSRWRPAERPAPDVLAERRASVRVDVIYTLIDRLGVLRVAMIFLVESLWHALFGWLALQGFHGWQLDQWLAPLVPGVTDTALASFLLYLVVFDFVNYWIHRAQHHYGWWWALHAVHHSQRQMTLWSDDRNHLLDSVLVGLAMALVARAIGVPPGQFIALVAISQLIENLAHANVRVHFGRIGERLVVSPRFHRLHHAIGLGHESGGPRTLGGHNFSVLFPLWDMLFGTARFGVEPGASGIRDQLPEEGGRDYGRGFWAQQWLGLLRMVGRA